MHKIRSYAHTLRRDQESGGQAGVELETWKKLFKGWTVSFEGWGEAARWTDDDPPFIVLTETKFSFRCIPVWDRYSPHRTRVEKKTHVIRMFAPR